MNHPIAARPALVPALTLALCCACGTDSGSVGGNHFGPSDPETGDGGGETDDGGDDDGSGGDDGGGDDGGDGDSGDDGGVKFDVPEGTGGPGDQTEGCEKIDFLFVVDNSGSMSDDQENLIQSFPNFMEAIVDTVGVTDFHILATDTDGEATGCLEYCATAPPEGTCNGAQCSGVPLPGECGSQLGGARTRGIDGQDCGLEGGKNYIVEGQSNLQDTFACMARHGGGEPMERQLDAIAEAISEPMNAAGACNEGFLRDDAILVITLISDEDHQVWPFDPQVYIDRIATAKNGNLEASALLGIYNTADCGNAEPNLEAFVNAHPNGVHGGVCAPDFTPFLVDAVGLIDETCDTFVPPG